MLRRITAKQFHELQMFEELEPPESVRDDYRAASIAQMIANVNRGKGQKAYTLRDFVLRWGAAAEEPPKRQTWQQQRQLLMLLAAAYSSEPAGKKK